MQTDISILIFFLTVFFYFILMLIEALLINNPLKWYYNHGILIYYNNGIIAGNVKIPLTEDFIDSLKTYKKYDKLNISLLEDNTYAIRELFFHYRFLEYFPIMRALLIINPVDRKFEFKGLLNLYTSPLIIFILILTAIFDKSSLILAIGIAIVLIPISLTRYILQSNRYSYIISKLTNQQ